MQLQLVAETRVKVAVHAIQLLAFVQETQREIAEEQRLQVPLERYCVVRQLQLVGDTRVKEVAQAVQVVALLQLLQLAITEEHRLHWLEAKY